MKNNEPTGTSGRLPWEQPTAQQSAPPYAQGQEPTQPLGQTSEWQRQAAAPLGNQHYWEPPTVPPVLTAPPQPQKPKGISRRAVLIGAGAGAVGIGALGAGLGFFLSNRASSSGPANVFASDAQQVAHLIRRAGLGPWPNDFGDYINAGVSGTIDRLLNYSSIPNSDLDNLLNSLNYDFSRPEDLIHWFTIRMLYSKHPLEEKMTMFWHGVLVSGLDKGGKAMPPYLAQQNQVLRQNCLGRFDDLIHAISTDPAMLVYLDGARSTGRLPNENYARELMELFTLGVVNPQGQPNYTQDDVHQGALALTGWAIEGGKGVYLPHRHYNGTVTYLGHTGNLGLDDVVRIVCAHPAAPYHIAWRMWSFFAYPVNPNDSVLQPLVDAYNHNNHSIHAMVEAMLRSPDFISDKAYRQRLKSPVEFLAGAIRNLGIQTTLQRNALRGLYTALGQVPFDPPNVSGWDGDKDSRAWLSTQTWMTRVNLINTLVVVATGGATGGKRQATQSASSTTNSPVQQTINQRGISSAKDLTDYYVAAMLDNNITSDRRSALYDAINQSGKGPTLTLAGGATVPAVSVRQMLYLLMTMPEYHLN